MKISRLAPLFISALLSLSSVAHGQLLSRSFVVQGGATGVTTSFTFWINANLNTFVVDINNALPTNPSTPLFPNPTSKVGTVVGFSFNTPWAVATSDVSFKAKWTQTIAATPVNPTSFTSNYWYEQAPFNLNGSSYDQEYGVSTGNYGYGRGVEYGEKATFSFKFSQNITAEDFLGFLDNQYSSSNPDNKDFDITVQWADVASKSNYVNDCYRGGVCDLGGVDLGVPSESELPVTPEPSTYGLMGAAALLGLVMRRRHLAKKQAAE